MNVKMLSIATGVLAVIAAGAGYLAWTAAAERDRLAGDLHTARAGADKARADLTAVRRVAEAAQKELVELRLTTERATTERDSVRKFMEAEQATGVRLRQELALAKEQISALSARMAGGRSGSTTLSPVPIRTAPPPPRLAPGGGSAAQGAPQLAR